MSDLDILGPLVFGFGLFVMGLPLVFRALSLQVLVQPLVESSFRLSPLDVPLSKFLIIFFCFKKEDDILSFVNLFFY